MASHRIWNWTKRQNEWLNWTLEVLAEYMDYLPVTLRQIFYRLVGKGYIENTPAQYEYASIVLKWARIDGHVPWD